MEPADPWACGRTGSDRCDCVCVCVYRSFDRAVEEWRQFHCNMNDVSQWLRDTEQVLADETGLDGDVERARAQQEVSKRVKIRLGDPEN